MPCQNRHELLNEGKARLDSEERVQQGEKAAFIPEPIKCTEKAVDGGNVPASPQVPVERLPSPKGCFALLCQIFRNNSLDNMLNPE